MTRRTLRTLTFVPLRRRVKQSCLHSFVVGLVAFGVKLGSGRGGRALVCAEVRRKLDVRGSKCNYTKDSVKTKVDFRPPAGARPPDLPKCCNFGRSLTFGALTKGQTPVKFPDDGTILGHPAKFEALRVKIECGNAIF